MPKTASSTNTTINIIGAGRLGRSLGKLWQNSNAATIAGICNRTQESSQKAADFIGAGTSVTSLQQLPSANLWLIATADGEIATVAQQLAANSAIKHGDTAFHCSGSLAADCLNPLQANGAHIASVHPVHSFASPEQSQHSFAGSYCAMEGDKEALNKLELLFQAIGGNCFALAGSEQKALYHSATVMACNYLITLQHSALQLLQQAGIDQAKGLELLAPIVGQTADNVFRQGTVAALTGPIARGDQQTVARHLAALQQQAPEKLPLYLQLAQHTLPIAEQQGSASQDQFNTIRELLTATKNKTHD